MKRSGLPIAVLALPILVCAGTLARPLPAAAQATNFRQEYQDLKEAIPGLGTDHAPIDYTERAPLVVPPTNDLPPPSAKGPELGLADPDAMDRRKALSDPRRPVPLNDPGAAAAGLSKRAYLIEPPSGTQDPALVAAEGAPEGPQTEAPKKHHKKKLLGIIPR